MLNFELIIQLLIQNSTLNIQSFLLLIRYCYLWGKGLCFNAY